MVVSSDAELTGTVRDFQESTQPTKSCPIFTVDLGTADSHHRERKNHHSPFQTLLIRIYPGKFFILNSYLYFSSWCETYIGRTKRHGKYQQSSTSGGHTERYPHRARLAYNCTTELLNRSFSITYFNACGLHRTIYRRQSCSSPEQGRQVLSVLRGVQHHAGTPSIRPAPQDIHAR